MTGRSRSHKHKLEPISIEELAGTTGMSGFGSLFTRDLSQGVPVLDRLDAGALDSGALDSSALDLGALKSGAPERSALESSALGTIRPTADQPVPAANQVIETIPTPGVSSALESGALDSSALDTDAAEDIPLQASLYRPPRIRPAATVQDGHSLGEQAVYEAMYKTGTPFQGESRLLTIGLRSLAELCRLAYANCKANVRSLVRKLAIQEGKSFSYTEGRTYIVYSYREILKRRRAAGLTHVVRTKGVVFVDPVSGQPISVSSALDTTALDTSDSALESIKSSAPETYATSALESTAPIRNRNSGSNQHQQPLAPDLIAQLRQYGEVSDAAAAELLALCRNRCPDLRTDELIAMIRHKMETVQIRSSFVGFLKVALPPCFEGESFRQFRLALQHRFDEEGRRREVEHQQDLSTAQAILTDGDSPADLIAWAEEVLRKG